MLSSLSSLVLVTVHHTLSYNINKAFDLILPVWSFGLGGGGEEETADIYWITRNCTVPRGGGGGHITVNFIHVKSDKFNFNFRSTSKWFDNTFYSMGQHVQQTSQALFQFIIVKITFFQETMKRHIVQPYFPISAVEYLFIIWIQKSRVDHKFLASRLCGSQLSPTLTLSK